MTTRIERKPSVGDTAKIGETLIGGLACDDPNIRERRKALVAIGSREVTAALVAELTDPRDQVRWEAAKALTSLADPVAAPALAQTLEDDNPDIRWLAAEGLIAMRREGLLVLLSALLKRSSSIEFRHGAYHVLRHLTERKYAPLVAPVLAALVEPIAAISVPLAAYKALCAIKFGPAPHRRNQVEHRCEHALARVSFAKSELASMSQLGGLFGHATRAAANVLGY